MKVEIKNIGVIKNAELEFKPGINLIIGSSGSGKSTLLRSIYNIATNSFSDSDISFNENSMNITISCDNDTVEYWRCLKTNGDRCYYKVNGEKFVKLGRQQLQNVVDVLKINDLEINGEKINFNFNMQFAAPFLILGSQSTLYNVLTYRSTFDISSINDYYTADIKCNNSELAATNKLKEKLSCNLESLEKQAKQLEPVEQLYSSYTIYKHKLSLVNDLKELLNKYKVITNLSCNISSINNITSSVDKAINTFNIAFDFDKYIKTYNIYNKLNNKVKCYDESINSHSKAMNTIQSIVSISKLQTLLNNKNINDYKIKQLKVCECSTSKFINKEEFINTLVKQYKNILLFNKCKNTLSVLENKNSNIIDAVDELIYINNKLKLYNKQCDYILKYNNKLDLINSEINSFNICPLCGNPLNCDKHVSE